MDIKKSGWNVTEALITVRTVGFVRRLTDTLDHTDISIPDSEKGVSVNDYGKWRKAEKNHATEPSPI